MRTPTVRSLAARSLVLLTWMLLWFGAFSLFGVVRSTVSSTPAQVLLGTVIFTACLGLGYVVQRPMLTRLDPATQAGRHSHV